MYSHHLCNMRTSLIALYNALFDLKYYLLRGRLSKSKSRPVVGFRPLVTSTGVFGINLSALVPILGSSEGGAQHNEQGNRTIMLYHSHLAIEFYNFKFRRNLWYLEGRIRGAIHAGPAPRSKRHKSLGTRKPRRTATNISPYHDSQF